MIQGNKIALRQKTLEDAQNDYKWQTDPELAYLDATPVVTLPFDRYLSIYKKELQKPPPDRKAFAVETAEGEHIGNCMYYNIDEIGSEAELGVMIGNHSYIGKGYGTDAVNTLINHVFSHTNLNRIHVKTLDFNIRAQKCFQKCKLVSYGNSVRDGYNFTLMEITRKKWQKQQSPKKDTASSPPDQPPGNSRASLSISN